MRNLTEEAAYERTALAELEAWRAKVVRPPGPWDRATREMQDRINAVIPDKVHQVVTAAIEQMTRGILTGADFATFQPLHGATLAEREARVRQQILVYRGAAAVEGGVAGAGGFLLAAAEFPVLLSTKLKLLFDVAALYGHEGSDFRERLYILLIFQLAFSSARHRLHTFQGLQDWLAGGGPASIQEVDWRTFQQEYRDYIDLAKLAQLLPVVGAPIGVVVNYRLLDRLGQAAMNAYRLRWFAARTEP